MQFYAFLMRFALATQQAIAVLDHLPAALLRQAFAGGRFESRFQCNLAFENIKEIFSKLSLHCKIYSRSITDESK